MTNEDKQLLLKVLCAMLPYGIICQLSNKDADVSIIEKLDLGGLEHFIVGSMCVKPYLRPMSNMTEKEQEEYCDLQDKFLYSSQYPVTDAYELFDWLNKNYFDYRGLIHMGLALEAPEDMYIIQSLWNKNSQNSSIHKSYGNSGNNKYGNRIRR